MSEPDDVGVNLLEERSGLFGIERFKSLLQDPTPVGVRSEIANVSDESLVNEIGTSVQSEQSLICVSLLSYMADVCPK